MLNHEEHIKANIEATKDKVETESNWWELDLENGLDHVIKGYTRDNPDDANLDWMGYDLPGLPDEEECEHKWVVTGHSPITNLPYENCKWCDRRKEDEQSAKENN